MECYWDSWRLYVNEPAPKFPQLVPVLKKEAGTVNFGMGRQRDLAVAEMKP